MHEENESPSKIKSTPPTNRKVRNPFDKVLISNLHKPLCSPGMCKVYKRQTNGTFLWEIDQTCTLAPADIVACNSQFEPSPDPALERFAEEATERYFSQELVIPSPHESSKKTQPLQTSYELEKHFSRENKDELVLKRDVSAQTVLTLPPELPQELEKILQTFCTFTQDQDMSGEYEITPNGSLRRKLFFEEHSDIEHYDSEQTDDEIQVEKPPLSSFDAHAPMFFSPDLSRNLLAKGMKRTFETPINQQHSSIAKSGYRNKILDSCLSPIDFHTPRRAGEKSATTSLASASISPVDKLESSDEEKNNFASPEAEAMATCLDCISNTQGEKKGPCFCKNTPIKTLLRRSTSLKESPRRQRKTSCSFSEKRSLSMSSLHRSRSVQKLDFSMDMSVDGSMLDHSRDDTESILAQEGTAAWSMVEEASIDHLVKGSLRYQSQTIQSSTKLVSDNTTILDETPVRGKVKRAMSHEISKIRAVEAVSPINMSLDTSLDTSLNPLNLEHKKVDLNNVDLKFLTENVSHYNNTSNLTKNVGDSSTSFKRIDSGFNENTFCTNASSYYESAIKPSELTITNVSKTDAKSALKEISNANWMRVDSGFKDETSSDSVNFYVSDMAKRSMGFQFSEIKDKENVVSSGSFERYLVQSTHKSDAMSMSDLFTDDMAFNCNFSSTPSKNKTKKFNT